MGWVFIGAGVMGWALIGDALAAVKRGDDMTRHLTEAGWIATVMIVFGVGVLVFTS